MFEKSNRQFEPVVIDTTGTVIEIPSTQGATHAVFMVRPADPSGFDKAVEVNMIGAIKAFKDGAPSVPSSDELLDSGRLVFAPVETNGGQEFLIATGSADDNTATFAVALSGFGVVYAHLRADTDPQDAEVAIMYYQARANDDPALVHFRNTLDNLVTDTGHPRAVGVEVVKIHDQESDTITVTAALVDEAGNRLDTERYAVLAMLTDNNVLAPATAFAVTADTGTTVDPYRGGATGLGAYTIGVWTGDEFGIKVQDVAGTSGKTIVLDFIVLDPDKAYALPPVSANLEFA